MILGRKRELKVHYNKLKKLLDWNLIIDEEIRKVFPKSIKVNVNYRDYLYSWDKEVKVEVIITPKSHKLTEKETFIIYDWLSKYGRWDEKLNYSGDITQTVDTIIKNIPVSITVVGRNSNFCTRELINHNKKKSYSFRYETNYKLVCK